MIFARYGITLERLTDDQIQMIRKWRNQDFVRSKMQYQQKITPKEQIAWFMRLHPLNDWFFIAYHEKSPFCLLHIKNINWETLSGEAGGFVSSPDLPGKPEVGFAILAMMDFAFYGLGLKKLEAKYNPEFKAINALNRQLGYEIFQDLKNGFVRARVSSEQYKTKAALLLNAAQRLKGKHSNLTNANDWLLHRLQQYGDPVALELDPDIEEIKLRKRESI